MTKDRERLLTPAEVASLFRVDRKTVGRWAKAGRLDSVWTPGGHRRFRESVVYGLLNANASSAPTGGGVAVSRAVARLPVGRP